MFGEVMNLEILDFGVTHFAVRVGVVVDHFLLFRSEVGGRVLRRNCLPLCVIEG